jgi:hypothetical protein
LEATNCLKLLQHLDVGGDELAGMGLVVADLVVRLLTPELLRATLPLSMSTAASHFGALEGHLHVGAPEPPRDLQQRE